MVAASKADSSLTALQQPKTLAVLMALPPKVTTAEAVLAVLMALQSEKAEEIRVEATVLLQQTIFHTAHHQKEAIMAVDSRARMDHQAVVAKVLAARAVPEEEVMVVIMALDPKFPTSETADMEVVAMSLTTAAARVDLAAVTLMVSCLFNSHRLYSKGNK